MSAAQVQLARLVEALVRGAFSGELTAKWREAHMKELLAEMVLQAAAIQALPSGS